MKLAILGSTGSIGTQALEVVEDLKGIRDIEVTAITGNRNIKLMEEQIRRFRPKVAAAADKKAAAELRIAVADTDCRVVDGEEGLCCAAVQTGADMVLSAIVGFAGLRPTLQAVEEGIDIALANKETLVTAGKLFMEAVRLHGVRLLPVDSEHCAIFQCLQAGRAGELRRILLTASGGPFFGKQAGELRKVKKEQALRHPNWTMGTKITIDSATLMNKGLEVMEAHWLFDVDIDCIRVVVHRESIVHSMVEFRDTSVVAQMSVPSMKHPIQYAFTYPERLPSPDPVIDFSALGKLTFYDPDENAFPCLALAKRAGKNGGIMPTVLNAANELAVAAFLRDEIGFMEIPERVAAAMERFDNLAEPALEDIFEADQQVREQGL